MSNSVYYQMFAGNRRMAAAAITAGCMVLTLSLYFLDEAFLIEWTLLPEGSSNVG